MTHPCNPWQQEMVVLGASSSMDTDPHFVVLQALVMKVCCSFVWNDINFLTFVRAVIPMPSFCSSPQLLIYLRVIKF